MAIIRFENCLLYTTSDESFRLSEVKNAQPLEFPHLFWIVEDSELVDEFHRQSLDIYREWAVTHYAFLSATDCVDVLSINEPTFSNVIEEEYFADY